MDINIVSPQILKHVAEGNIPVIVLGSVLLFLLLWIRHERSIKSLFSFLKGKNAREEAQKEKRAFEINTQLFFDKMVNVISSIEAIKISNDEGRDYFHHWMLRTLLDTLYEEATKNYTEYQTGEISAELFCSFHKHQYGKIRSLKEILNKKISDKLKAEGWKESQICYVLVTFNTWFEPHKAMLSELLKTSRFPEGIIMAWWVLFYELLISIEKFGFLLNGRLKGEVFDGLTLGDCYE